ncbi:MAG: hypothetical protein JNN04_15925 [Cyclobacteriaceae bacterium]|nr:hypothetical protein [Cyclobacteriaceae bacterium]
MLKWLVLILLAVSGSLLAQTLDDQYEKLPWPNTFELGYFRVSVPGIPIQDAFGYTGEYLIGSRWGAEWSVAAGDRYFHAGFGSIIGPIAILLNNCRIVGSSGIVYLVIAGFTLAEHTNYHIPLGRGVQWVPYVSLYKWRSFDYPAFETGEGTSTWSLGMKLSLIHREKWFVNFFGEAGMLYYKSTPSIVIFGVNVGYFTRSNN